MGDEIPITIGLAAQLIAIATPLIGLWLWFTRQVGNVRSELMEYKLEAAEKFTRAEHLKEFEERLIKTETRTLEAIKHLTQRIDNLIQSNSKD